MALGLSDFQIEQIIRAVPKRDYFVHDAEHWAKISLDLGHVALTFLASNGAPDRELVDRLIAENPKGWQADFLRLRGLNDWANYMEAEL
jgi:type IV secretion system protein VirB4